MKRLPKQPEGAGGLAIGARSRVWVRLRPYLIPAILLLCVTLPHFRGGDWQRGDSGWYTAIGLQAWETGELWSLMGEPGQTYFNKPPLVFWVTGATARVFGPGPIASRGPTVVAALGCVLVLVSVARVFGSRRTALASGIVLALSLEFFRRTREVSLDMWQLLFLLLAVWAVAVGVKRSGWKGFALAGMGLGLALMCKPLVAMVALAAMAVWLVGMKQVRRVPMLFVTAGVAFLVAGPWHVSMYMLHGEAFIGQYFGDQIINRAGGGNVTSATSVFFYVEQLLKNHWPWLVFVVLALVGFMRASRRAKLSAGTRTTLVLALAWTGVWLVALSAFPDRRDRYGIALQPGLAMMAGVWLGAMAPRWFERATRRKMRLAVPVAVVGAVVFSLLPVTVQRPINPQWPALFAWIESQDGLVDAEGQLQLYQGGFRGDHGSRLFLELGSWPITTIAGAGEIVASPPTGSFIIYHRRGGRSPGGNEAVAFTSGDLTVTQLTSGAWGPVIVEDPGEGPN